MTILLVITVAAVIILTAVSFGLLLTVFRLNSRLEQAYVETKAATVRQRRAETAMRDSGLNPEAHALAAEARRAEVNRLTTLNTELNRELVQLRQASGVESSTLPPVNTGLIDDSGAFREQAEATRRHFSAGDSADELEQQ